MVRKKVVKDLREDCDCNRCEYCPLEVLLLSLNKESSDRLWIQHKCVEIYKWNLGKEGRQVDFEEAYKGWAASGMAKLFAKHYDPDKTPKQIYKLIEGDRNEN